MKVAAGFKAHSGWAAVVVVGAAGDGYEIVERVVEKGLAVVRAVARRELHALVERLRREGRDVAGCAVLTGAPMPRYSVEQVLAVHVRMHQAEGAMFVDALCNSVEHARMPLVRVPAKDADGEAGSERIASLGKRLGPPWARDQRLAAAAALRVLARA